MSFTNFSTVGFSGSRRLSGSSFGRVKNLAALAAHSSHVFTGCAAGADNAARVGGGAAVTVFTAQSSRPAHLVQRSIQFAQALAAQPAPLLVSFPLGGCPGHVQPRSAWVSCGSGSWSTLALCVGLGVPALVSLPPSASVPAWGRCTWSYVGRGGPFHWLGLWQVKPHTSQLSLF